MDDQLRVLAHRYEIGELLGRGGMAVVHAGRDIRLGRQVAIKMLRADMARDPNFQARFRREAQSAAALNHPSIVAVYDTGEDVSTGVGGVEEHVPFIVMEYVEGRTLREILHSGDEATAAGRASREKGRHADPNATAALGGTDNVLGGPYGRTGPESATRPLATGGEDEHENPLPMDVDHAVQMTAGVLSALEYSHRAGIVHRDIKPANVMVTPSGSVKVMDFGIARAVADSSATMTQTQAVIGTAQYLSPEQARGETVDARSDLYSAGCLLYELLTGRPPFVGDSPVSVAYQHVREVPQPPSTFNPEVTPALDRVVLHALAKDREERYPDARAFRSDLLAAHAGRPVTAPTVAAAGAGAAAATAATTAIPTIVPAPLPVSEDEVAIDQVDYDDEEPPRRRAAGYVALALAVLAVFALAAFLITQVVQPDQPATAAISVPDVKGMTKVEAKAELDKAGLVYAEGTPENNDTVPLDSVISQDPEAGASVEDGATVTVVLSLGVAEAEVPNLAGKTQAEARDLLAGAGLEVGDITTADDPKIEKDRVISSDPEAGSSVPTGSVVSLVVSSGEVTVPDLKGKPYLEARDILLNLGLGAESQGQEDGSVDPDTVLSQDPGAGSVQQGSTITLTIATAPPPPTETEPPPTEPPPTDVSPTVPPVVP